MEELTTSRGGRVMRDLPELISYYLGFSHKLSDQFFDNKDCLWISEQLDYLDLQDWCYEFNWTGV